MSNELVYKTETRLTDIENKLMVLPGGKRSRQFSAGTHRSLYYK